MRYFKNLMSIIYCTFQICRPLNAVTLNLCVSVVNHNLETTQRKQNICPILMDGICDAKLQEMQPYYISMKTFWLMDQSFPFVSLLTVVVYLNLWIHFM